MKSRSRRLLIGTAILILVLAALCYFSSIYLERRITSQIVSRGGSVESLDLSLFSRSLEIKNLTWRSPADSNQITHSLNLKNISVTGIGLLPLLFDHVLKIDKIILDGGEAHYVSGQKLSNAQDTSKQSLKEIEIGRLIFNNIKTEAEKDTTIVFSGNVSLDLKSLHWKKSLSSDSLVYAIKSWEILLENSSSQSVKGRYRFEADKVHFGSEDKKLEIDSFRLLPLFGKYEFAQKANKQETRATLRVAQINLTGFDYLLLKDSLFSVSKIEINNPDLWVFRDKRLPFKNPYIPLPIQLLKRVAYGLKVDSIIIKDGKIKHEEMAEKGVKPGHLDFLNLNAKIANFNNRQYPDRPDFMLIKAHAKIMKTGFIEATFTMPFDNGKKYSTKGRILHLNLTELNTMTEPAAFLHIESGQLNMLSFSFEYDEYLSRGKTEISYENLTMAGLNKSDNKTINPFKTLLLNTFIKHDKNKETPRENRTGIIYVERDRRKFVANLWAKSLFNGMQSILLPGAMVSKEKKPKK